MIDSSAPRLRIQDHVCLQAYNTLAIPVKTRWFTELIHESQIDQVLDFIRDKQCPLLVLGGGSNIVLANNFAGLTLHLKTQGMAVEKETEEHVYLSVAAGENWHNTVMYCVEQGWYGLENLALIPGSVGAAPIQNIGAYGVELTQCFSYLEAVELSTGKTLIFNQAGCEFAYRDSVFKQRCKDQFIITRVVLVLSKKPQWALNYPALHERLGAMDKTLLTSRCVAETVIDIRQSKLPDPLEIPNAGSFFKNPVVAPQTYNTLKQQYPHLVAYAQYDPNQVLKGYKLAAGWLLDNAGWKGRMHGGVSMHKDQALVLTNPNRVSGDDLLHFVTQVQADIRSKYGVALEIEPRIYSQALAQG